MTCLASLHILKIPSDRFQLEPSLVAHFGKDKHVVAVAGFELRSSRRKAKLIQVVAIGYLSTDDLLPGQQDG